MSLRLLPTFSALRGGKLDYGSDDESEVSTPVQDYRPMQSPNQFPERGAANALTALHTTPVWSRQSSRTRSTRSTIRCSNNGRALGADLRSYRHSKVILTICSRLSVWRNVSDKRLVSLWHRGPWVRRPLRLTPLRRVGYYARDTWFPLDWLKVSIGKSL